MFDPLIDFLNTIGRLPGCSKAFALRDALREGQYRRARAKASLKGSLGMVRNARSATSELMTSVLPSAAAATPSATPAGVDVDAGPTRTLLRLRPAGREAPKPAAHAVPAATPARVGRVPMRGSGLNALVDAATELLTLAAQLRGHAAAPSGMRQLRVDMAHKVTTFDAAARAAGVASEQVVAARYALCTLLDEMVLTTPWGADSPWGQHSLLSQFHNETWGGEKFFKILERLLADPARHRPVLEFMYLCLALGMQGQHRVAHGGMVRLHDVQARLYQAIRRMRGEPEGELSPHWHGARPAQNRLVRVLPLWVVGGLAALALMGAYAAFSLDLARQAEPVYAELARIGQGAEQTLAVTVPAVPRTLTLREALAADIRDGRLDVVEQARGSTIEIHGDGFFASGSAEIDAAVLPVLARIGAALNRFDAPLQVFGHTDDQPVAMSRRLRFASNRELSQARADAVAAVLAQQLSRPARLSSEGRGDAEPAVPNDTPAHRAQNRRVDITLLGAGAGSVAAPAPSSELAATFIKRPT